MLLARFKPYFVEGVVETAARKYREEYLDSVLEAINHILDSAERNNAAASIQVVSTLSNKKICSHYN